MVEKDKLKCRRCGKSLKNPKSRELGYGPTCLKKHIAEALKIKPLFRVKKQ